MRLKRAGAPEREVEIVSMNDSTVVARIDGEELSASLEMLTDGSAMLAVGEHRYRIAGSKRTDTILIGAGAMSAAFQIVEARRGSRQAGLTSPTVDAPMPGTVLKILVKEGARVEQNDPLVVLEAMKTETTLSAESAAIVKRVCVQVGQKVDHGARLIELASAPQ